MSTDEKYIIRCIELAKQALQKGEAPFSSLIVKDDKIIAESINGAAGKISDHAEILVLDKAHKNLANSDLTGCILYSICEPCPMCSFMIREYKISKVVFSLPSPYMGGFSKWPILQDRELEKFEKIFFSTAGSNFMYFSKRIQRNIRYFRFMDVWKQVESNIMLTINKI